MREERNAGGCRETTSTETILCEVAQLVRQYGPEFAALHREEKRIGWQPMGSMSLPEAEQISNRLDAIYQRIKEITGEIIGQVHRLMLEMYAGGEVQENEEKKIYRNTD